MSEKFTPGPWFIEVGRDEDNDGDIYVCHQETECNETTIVNFEEPTDEDAANAHLIASAPEMYAMLKEIKDKFLYPLSHENSEIGQSAECLGPFVDELLKKARGKS